MNWITLLKYQWFGKSWEPYVADDLALIIHLSRFKMSMVFSNSRLNIENWAHKLKPIATFNRLVERVAQSFRHAQPSVRKQHNAGYKHKANVRIYYQQYEAQLNQSFIDQKVKEHLVGGAFRPPVAPYNQLRPGMPIIPPPLPVPGQLFPGAPSVPGFRPPVFPRPMPGVPGYAAGPPMPQMPPPGAPLTGQPNGLQRPGTVPLPPPPAMVPSSGGIPTSGGPPMYAPPVTLPATATGAEGSNVNAQAPEAN
ncbi:U1 small nuclear ribonucleoprotein C [Striga hermonthica]|uniref:U1 small nuclear ribonucleoprotein C n=1 Tax=Striga hermonthica TaxID=68872 RepID=A0A9N7RFP8_STRHE|nr:U1 small nuclear ribonucleoprotein C [Striga hermonthica]